MEKIRPMTVWAVTYGNGLIDLHSIRPLRWQAIEAFTSDPAMPRWDHWRKIGCRAVKLLILPEPPQ